MSKLHVEKVRDLKMETGRSKKFGKERKVEIETGRCKRCGDQNVARQELWRLTCGEVRAKRKKDEGRKVVLRVQ